MRFHVAIRDGYYWVSDYRSRVMFTRYEFNRLAYVVDQIAGESLVVRSQVIVGPAWLTIDREDDGAFFSGWAGGAGTHVDEEDLQALRKELGYHQLKW